MNHHDSRSSSENEINAPLLSRREMLRLALCAPAAMALGRVGFGLDEAAAQATPAGPFKLPPLPYRPSALEPFIDARTMTIHHDKHHKKYVDELNKAVAKAPALRGKTAQELIRNLDSVPESIQTAIRNNGGGHVNHSMFWQIMEPRGGGRPTGAIAQAINGTFGSFANFQHQFNDAGAKRFGSGWVWLVSDRGQLKIMSTPNQDNPMMLGMFPIMGNDVWEHAYYLKYQNRRPEYLKAWWNVVNWDEVNKRFAASRRM